MNNMDTMIGTVIDGRYEILDAVDSGGMADVYRAYDRSEERVVAIKMIKSEYCADAQYVRRFEREADAVLKLESVNIVQAYAYGSWAGRSYIVLEFIDGVNLKEYLAEKKKLTPRTAVHIACRVLDALECAHNAGYVHRDVKPQNVLIAKDKSIKLTDFGIAKRTETVNTRTFDKTGFVGSIHYISPEQALNGETGKRSDLYSVGIMLFEMLVGRPPFDDADNPLKIALAHSSEPLPVPSEIDPEIPRSISNVIIKATAKRPALRYASAREMRRALVYAFQHPNSRFPSTKGVDVHYDPKADKQETSGKRARVHIWHFILPAALMVALVAGIFCAWYFIAFKPGDSNKLSKVPDVLGKTLEEAETLLKNRDFEIRLAGTMGDTEYPEGSVCRQSPESGTAREKGATVEVWVSSGTQTASMQNLVGRTLEDAMTILLELGIEIDSISYDLSDEPERTVLWQSIPEGTEVVAGEESISIEISGAPGITLVPMPDLTKLTSLGGIASVLRVYGVTNYRFRCGDEPKNDNGGVAVLQTPNAGIPFLPSATMVEITLYSDFFDACNAEIGFELVVDADGTEVIVTVPTEYGEFVIFDGVLDKADGPVPVHFSAGFMKPGEHQCIVYTNGTETMRFNVLFKR